MNFYLCRRCYRGQAYCCEVCRILGTREKKSQRQRRYRKTDKGKQKHRENENRRRQRKKEGSETKLGDASSMLAFMRAISLLIKWMRERLQPRQPSGPPRCRACGCPGEIVSRFERRGYT